jgi:hypothetical protein
MLYDPRLLVVGLLDQETVVLDAVDRTFFGAPGRGPAEKRE